MCAIGCLTAGTDFVRVAVWMLKASAMWLKTSTPRHKSSTFRLLGACLQKAVSLPPCQKAWMNLCQSFRSTSCVILICYCLILNFPLCVILDPRQSCRSTFGLLCVIVFYVLCITSINSDMSISIVVRCFQLRMCFVQLISAWTKTHQLWCLANWITSCGHRLLDEQLIFEQNLFQGVEQWGGGTRQELHPDKTTGARSYLSRLWWEHVTSVQEWKRDVYVVM